MHTYTLEEKRNGYLNPDYPKTDLLKAQSSQTLKYRQHRIKTQNCKAVYTKDLLVNVDTPNSRIDFYCTGDVSSKAFTSMTSDRKDKKKDVIQYDNIKDSYNTANPREDAKKPDKKKTSLFIPKKNLVKHYKTQ